MQARFGRAFRYAMICCIMLAATVSGMPALAAPYAAMVMDARSGEVIFARNHDTKLHPASLTKMMTLYVAFEAIKHGEVTLDTMFTVSQRATGVTCVCLGLRPGQRISLRHLIRAAALRSANDAAMVIAEGISGSVEAFAERMTRTGRAMGMANTTFRNPHGLTQSGHLSTARDMTILGRQLYFDYPQYYNLFSRRSEDAGVAVVPNTNRRFLDAYQGADGIKTGYTRAAGFNLTASAKRGNRHIIATMFGGASTAARNAHVAELLDIGFSRAPNRVALRPPQTPAYGGRGGSVAVAAAASDQGSARTIRLQTAVRSSPRPRPRPEADTGPAEDMLVALLESVEASVSQISDAAATPAQAAELPPDAVGESAEIARVGAEIAPVELELTPPPRPEALVASIPQSATPDLEAAQAAGFSIADPDDIAALDDAQNAGASSDNTAAPPPPVAEATDAEEISMTEIAGEPSAHDAALAPEVQTAHENADPTPETVWTGSEGAFLLVDSSITDSVLRPSGVPLSAPGVGQFLNVDLDFRPNRASPAPEHAGESGIILTSSAQPVSFDETPAVASVAEAHAQSDPRADPQVVSRLSTSDTGRIWGVSLGQFTSRNAAERSLITVKMAEAQALGNGVSRIRQASGRFEASFAGLTATEAERACLRLQARRMDCSVLRP